MDVEAIRERRYVVAINQAEARELADEIGWPTRKEAEAHLKEVKAPPTDPYYANQYRVYVVDKKGGSGEPV